VLLSKGDTVGHEDLVLGRATELDGDMHYVLPLDGVDLHEVENDLIRQALARTGNNQTQAAKLLNLSRDALRYRLEKLGML